MAENVDALIERLKKVRAGILEDGMIVAKSMALNHKAQVVRRIQSEGIPDAQYSDKGVPAYLYSNDKWENSYARLNSGFEKMIKEKKKKEEMVAWKDVRDYQGLQTGFVDYTFTGRTFKNLTIVDTRIVGTSVYADLGGSDQETKDRLKYGFDRYGNFLAPNDTEKKLLLTLTEKAMKKSLDKYSLA